MASVGAQFSHLHSLYVRLKDIQDQLAKGPRQIRIRQNRITEVEQQLVLTEQELKDARTTVDRKNLDLRSKEAHLLDMQGKLNTASSNREYDIIRGQIDADLAAKAVLEDEILEWLDRVDGVQKNIVDTKERVKTMQAESREFATDFETKAVELQQREAALKKSISETEVIVPNEMKAQYQRLVEAYGAEAMASSENGVCNQCFVSLTSQNKVQLNSGKLMFCSVCGRLLYPVDKESR
ncbi:MAG TPA: hypothetical protein VNQ76_09135 [Planctomicrobium sp.]|nr:hypothetical protein [Planctomicrobium sp.]